MQKTNGHGSFLLKSFVLIVFLLLPAAAAVCGTFDPPVPGPIESPAVKDAIQDLTDTPEQFALVDRTNQRMQPPITPMACIQSEPRAQASGSMINGLHQEEPHIDAPEL